jgi:hypothetical protein
MGEWREAAKHAIESLDLEAIRAESFLAQPTAPRGACLQAVRESDAIVVLLGEHYGTALPGSALSATEQEVEEAAKRGQSLLVFLVSERRDEKKEQFLRRIAGWIGGTFYKQAHDPHELQKEIVRALRALQREPDAAELRAAVSQVLASVVPGKERSSSLGGQPWVGFSWGASTGTFSIDEDEFFEELPERVGDVLVTGKQRLLEIRPQVRHKGDALLITPQPSHQARRGRALCGCILRTGVIAMGVEIEGRDENAFAIQPHRVAEAVDGILSALGETLSYLDPDRIASSGLAQGALSNLGIRYFASPKRSLSGGVPINAISGDRPIVVPARPERLLRSELSAGSRAAALYLQRFQREASPPQY